MQQIELHQEAQELLSLLFNKKCCSWNFVRYVFI